MSVSWPVACIEVVLAGTGERTLPIQLGFARWRDLDAPIENWGCGIFPSKNWLDRPTPSAPGRKPRGSGRVTDPGEQAATICRRLDTELFGCAVCCDGLTSAQRSLEQLYAIAGTRPFFAILPRADLEACANPGMARWLDVNDDYPEDARERAVWLMRAFASGLKRRPDRIILS